MSLLLSDPAAPGTVPADQLAKVHELHAAVRRWIEASAVAQKNDHLRVNFPYVDLMFAFGFATLGDHDSANKLVEDARQVLEGPVPEGVSRFSDPAVTSAIVRNFLFKAFQHRIAEAAAGRPHEGPLSEVVMHDWDHIATIGERGPLNGSYKLANYVLARFREYARIVEPTERVDVYEQWTTKGDALKKELASLRRLREASAFAERVRTLCQNGLPGKDLAEVRFEVILETLRIGRIEEGFAAELLSAVPGAVRFALDRGRDSPDTPRRRAEMLQRAITLAASMRRNDSMQPLLDAFYTVLAGVPADAKPSMVSMVAPVAIRSLRMFNMHAELERFVTTCDKSLLNGNPVAMWRDHSPKQPERRGTLLESLVHLVPGWLHLNLNDKVNVTLKFARDELLDLDSRFLLPLDYTNVARAYVAALGQTDRGLEGIAELFALMNPKKITNHWTTAQNYSRLHLQLVEDTVFAVCNYCLDSPLPHTVTT